MTALELSAREICSRPSIVSKQIDLLTYLPTKMHLPVVAQRLLCHSSNTLWKAVDVETQQHKSSQNNQLLEIHI